MAPIITAWRIRAPLIPPHVQMLRAWAAWRRCWLTLWGIFP